MVDLNLKDKKILFELDKNSRQSLKLVSKKTGLSREVVNYRLGNLLREGVIQKFLAVIDVSKFGFAHHKVYVKLQNITEGNEELLVNKLIFNPFITWIASCDGAYSLIFAVKSRNLVELNKIMQEIEKEFGSYFMEYEIAGIIEAIHFERKYLVQRKDEFKEVKWGRSTELKAIDKVDSVILHGLAKDARARAIDIAREANCSPDTIAQRIRKLEDTGIIQKYMLFLDNIKMGQLYYKVLIGLKPITEEFEKRILNYCSAHPNIIYVVKSFGKWNLEIDIEVDNVIKFRQVIRDFFSKFSAGIKDYSPLNIYGEYKFNFFEKEILDKV